MKRIIALAIIALASACAPEPTDNGGNNGSGNGGQTSTPSHGSAPVPNTGGWQNNTPCVPGLQDAMCASGYCYPASHTCENNVQPGTANLFSATGTPPINLTIEFWPGQGGNTRAINVTAGRCFYLKSDPSKGEKSYTVKWTSADGKLNEWDLWKANNSSFAGMNLPFTVRTVIEATHLVYPAVELQVGEAALGGTHVAKGLDYSKLPNRVEMDIAPLGTQSPTLGSCP
jgi:hypothetical protein